MNTKFWIEYGCNKKIDRDRNVDTRAVESISFIASVTTAIVQSYSVNTFRITAAVITIFAVTFIVI